MLKNIFVYADEGAGPAALKNTIDSLKKEVPKSYTIKRLKKESIKDGAWCNEAALLVFPGGRDIYYHRDLEGVPNSIIRDYVENGGAYLGFCAGAYYGAATIAFEVGFPLEVVATRELAFFPGKAEGPAYGNNLFRYGSECGASVCTLEWMEKDEQKGKHYYSYFNGGCQFVGAEGDPNVKTLAKYADIQNAPAAIVECSFGKGKVILCGAHPEYAAASLNGGDPYLAPIKERLEVVESDRRHLLRKLLARLYIV